MIKNIKPLLAFVLVLGLPTLTLFQNCGQSGEPMELTATVPLADGADPSLSAKTQAIRSANCTVCHNGPSAAEPKYILDDKYLITGGWIKPALPDESPLYLVLLGGYPQAPRMPLGSDPLGIDQIELIRQWITAIEPITIPPPFDPPTPIVLLPAPPNSLVATTVAAAQINLTWVDSSNNESGFKIERATSSAGPFSLIFTTTANVMSYASQGLSASTTYYYRISSYNTAGTSAYTSIASAVTQAAPVTAPTAPSSLTATAVSSGQINLTWVDSSNNESGFKIERATSSAGPFSLIFTTPANIMSYASQGLSASTTYYYRISSYNAVGNSTYTAVVNASTLQPIVDIDFAAVKSVLESKNCLVCHGAEFNTYANLMAFKRFPNTTPAIEPGDAAASRFMSILEEPSGEAAMVNGILSMSTEQITLIRNWIDAGAPELLATVAPAAPSSLAATSASSVQINLAWVDSSNDESGFKIERATSSAGPFSLIFTTSANVTSYASAGLAAATTYYYRISSYNIAGTSAYTSIASAVTQAAPVTPPTAPSSLTAAAVSQSQINLTWVDSSNNESGFKIERATSSTGPFTLVFTTGANVTNYMNTGLTAATTYYYRINSYNAAGNSSYTAVANALTQQAPVAPTAPTSLTATTVSSGQINLTWVDSSNNESGFKIERATSSAGPFTLIYTAAANVKSYASQGLAASITYYYRINSYNTVGNSSYTPIASATTSAAPPITAMDFATVKSLLESRSCMGCHGQEFNSYGNFMTFKRAPNTTASIIPGDAANSRFMDRLELASGEPGMVTAVRSMTAAQVTFIQNWIDAGAKEFEPGTGIQIRQEFTPILGDRYYVVSVLNKVFQKTPTIAVPSTPAILKSIDFFGGACHAQDTEYPDLAKAGRVKRLPFFDNQCFQNTSITAISGAQNPESNIIRESMRVSACFDIADSAGTANDAILAALEKVNLNYGSPWVDLNLTTVYQSFYPGQIPSAAVKASLKVLADKAMTSSLLLRNPVTPGSEAWRFIYLSLCVSPGWQAP